MLELILSVAMGMLAIAAVLVVLRVIGGPTLPDRVVALDLIGVLVVCFAVLGAAGTVDREQYEVARQLIDSNGSNMVEPAVNFYQGDTDPMKIAEDTAQAFFGIRIQCAQCHNHPFDRWTMEDYRGFVAFFTQVGRKSGEDPRERIVFNRGAGESLHPVGNKVELVERLLERGGGCCGRRPTRCCSRKCRR